MKQAILLAVLMVAFLTATNTIAQQLPRARITSIFPAGGQQGTTMEAAIAGGDLEEAKQLFFSHPGIKAVPKKDDNGKVVANKYAITIAKNVPVGIYDVQAGGGRFGISNVRAFAVGDLPEVKSTAGMSADKAMEIKVGTTIRPCPDTPIPNSCLRRLVHIQGTRWPRRWPIHPSPVRVLPNGRRSGSSLPKY